MPIYRSACAIILFFLPLTAVLGQKIPPSQPAASRLPVVSKSPAVSSLPAGQAAANSPKMEKVHEKNMMEAAIQNAYSNYNGAVCRRDLDGALKFQTPEYTEIGADGQAKPQPPEQVRQSLTTLFHDYRIIFAMDQVDSVTLDAAGGATVQARDRRTLWTAGSIGTQADRQIRDYLVQDGGTWHLARRRILSETRRSAQMANVFAVIPTAAEKKDLVFGPDAPQPVERVTFFPYFYRDPVTLEFYHNGKSAKRILPAGRPAAVYAQTYADICTELGVKNKRVGDSVYVTEAGGVGLAGHCEVDLEMATIRP